MSTLQHAAPHLDTVRATRDAGSIAPRVLVVPARLTVDEPEELLHGNPGPSAELGLERHVRDVRSADVA